MVMVKWWWNGWDDNDEMMVNDGEMEDDDGEMDEMMTK